MTVQQASICISEPPDSPKSQKSQGSPCDETHHLLSQQSIQSLTPSPPPFVSIMQSPPTSPLHHQSSVDEKEKLIVNHHAPTITEELTEADENTISSKSSLTLPVEPLTPSISSNPPSSHPHKTMVERTGSDRRRLSVHGLMGFAAERRRSSSSIFSDMRKMSITNFDGIKSPGIGTIAPSLTLIQTIISENFYLGTPGLPRARPSSKMTKYVECWGADKPFANITDSKMAKNIGLAVIIKAFKYFQKVRN